MKKNYRATASGMNNVPVLFQVSHHTLWHRDTFGVVGKLSHHKKKRRIKPSSREIVLKFEVFVSTFLDPILIQVAVYYIKIYTDHCNKK